VLGGYLGLLSPRYCAKMIRAHSSTVETRRAETKERHRCRRKHGSNPVANRLKRAPMDEGALVTALRKEPQWRLRLPT
ncbi:hypothetical protein ABG768_023510, partial [Culter alburnus]